MKASAWNAERAMHEANAIGEIFTMMSDSVGYDRISTGRRSSSIECRTAATGRRRRQRRLWLVLVLDGGRCRCQVEVV